MKEYTTSNVNYKLKEPVTQQDFFYIYEDPVPVKYKTLNVVKQSKTDLDGNTYQIEKENWITNNIYKCI